MRFPMRGVLAPLVIFVPALAQVQFEELGKQHLPIDRDNTQAVVCCDVDRDGDDDLVFGNSRQRNRLYLNDGTGTFADATASRMPPDMGSTLAVACCDVDGDGDPDLVFGNSPGGGFGGGQNRLYLNDGTGRFTDATAARMPSDGDWSSAVACCDVDGDGDVDLVFGNGEACGLFGCPGQQNRLYLNDGTGTFTDATAFRMPAQLDASLAVACCDVDRDGDPDLVFGNGRQNRLYLNDGQGHFTDATAGRMPSDTDSTQAVACCDVDRDGNPDLVFGNWGQQNRLYLNNGTGSFTDATAIRMPPDTDYTRDIECCDVDRDGDPDLVFANDFGQQNRLYLNDGQGHFTDATASRMPRDSDSSYALAGCDVDNDGDPDLVFGNYQEGQDRLYFNDGTGMFTAATAARMPLATDLTWDVACCDVDGDGDPDLVFANDLRQQNRLYLNDGQGHFTDATAGRMPSDTNTSNAVVCCDVDRDGDSDLIFGNSGQNRLYLNDGQGHFTDATASRMPRDSDYTTAVACCDVDGDGDADLVFGNYNAQRNRLYRNDGTGTFTDVTASRMPRDSDYTSAVACCDVDGDGDLDLVFGNADIGLGGQNRLYLNDGSGTFSDVTARHMPPVNDNSRGVACCDVDGDGDPDLVFGNYAGRDGLYLNDGQGHFTDATAGRMPPNIGYTFFVTSCDLDGDGDPDLLFGSSRLYLNVLRQLHAPYLTRLGRSYRLDAYSRHGPASLVDVALPALSFATARIPLPPLGTLGLDPSGIVALPAFVIPQPAGMGSVSIMVPNNPSLVGGSVYAQALLVRYPIQDRLTNVTADVIRR